MIRDILFAAVLVADLIGAVKAGVFIGTAVTQAVAAKEAVPRKWWNPAMIVQLETVIEVPVVKIVEKIIQVPAGRGSSVVWNEEFLKTEPPKNEPLRWKMETSPTCGVCIRNWSDTEKALRPKGWLFGTPGNHFEKEEVDLEEMAAATEEKTYSIPVWKLMLGDKELVRHVGYVAPAILKAEYLKEFEVANAPQGPAKSIDAGTITKGEVEGYIRLFVTWFGPEGSAVVPNLKRREPWNGMNIDVPANVGFSWKVGGDGGCVVNFNADTRPVGRWGIFSQSVSSMIYDPAIGEVRFVTPLARYSPVLKVIE